MGKKAIENAYIINFRGNLTFRLKKLKNSLRLKRRSIYAPYSMYEILTFKNYCFACIVDANLLLRGYSAAAVYPEAAASAGKLGIPSGRTLLAGRMDKPRRAETAGGCIAGEKC